MTWELDRLIMEVMSQIDSMTDDDQPSLSERERNIAREAVRIAYNLMKA